MSKITVHVDKYTKFCLTAIAALMTVLIVMLWAQGPTVPQAQAAEPFLDAAGDRKAAVDAAKETNQKMGDLIDLLKSGQVKVQVVQEGDKHGK